MKPSVTFVTHDGYRLPTARIRCYRFAEELARRGFDTRVVSTVDHLGAPLDGGDVVRLSDTRKAILNAKLFQRLLENPTDVIYLQKLGYHAPAAIMACKRNGLKLVFDYDDYELSKPPFRFNSWLPGASAEALTRNTVERANANVAASHYLKDLFDAWKPGTKLIPTGVDANRFKPKSRENRDNRREVVFSWMGVVWGEPVFNAVEFMIDCFRKAEFSNAVLRLQGGGAMWGEVERLARTDSRGARVEALGWAAPDDVPSIMDEIDVGLIPIIQDTPFNRSKSPTKLFEYMAMEKPCICGAIGETRHVVDHGQNGFIASTSDEWVELIRWLYADASLRRKVGEEARRDVEARYSMDVIGGMLESAIMEAVG